LSTYGSKKSSACLLQCCSELKPWKDAKMKITAKLIKEMVEEQLAEMNAAAATAGASPNSSGPPDIDDDARAAELLDGFRSMLKPNEKADPSACATFLRQLADLVDHENAASGGNMPETNPDQLEEGELAERSVSAQEKCKEKGGFWDLRKGVCYKDPDRTQTFK
jgi:hypothetical protein